jgi:hypothetical protein
MMVNSPVVSQRVPVGFSDLVKAADELPGQEFSEGRIRMKVHGRVGTGLPGAVRLAGTLRTTAALHPSVKVEVVVSPWSAGRSEVAIHPITNLGQFESVRAHRFFVAAEAILPVLIDRLNAERPVEAAAQLPRAA